MMKKKIIMRSYVEVKRERISDEKSTVECQRQKKQQAEK